MILTHVFREIVNGEDDPLNRSKPKIMAPVNSLEGAFRVIRAGADEVYCGVALPTKYRSSYSASCC